MFKPPHTSSWILLYTSLRGYRNLDFSDWSIKLAIFKRVKDLNEILIFAFNFLFLFNVHVTFRQPEIIITSIKVAFLRNFFKLFNF